MLIKHWEFHKKILHTYGINSKVGGSIIEYLNTIYTKAIDLYGYDWVKENLKPIA